MIFATRPPQKAPRILSLADSTEGCGPDLRLSSSINC